MIDIMIGPPMTFEAPRAPQKKPSNIMIGGPSRANIMIDIMIDIMIGPSTL